MADTTKKQGKVPLPKRITVEEIAASPVDAAAPYRGDAGPAAKGHLRIARRWFSWQYVVLLVFCIIWDGCVVFWYKVSLTASGVPLLAVVIPLVHVAVGLGLTYTVVAGFLNRTVISVSPERLTVRHGPLPWFGNRDLPSREIEQLYCERRVTETDDGQVVRFELAASLHDGRKVRLLKGLDAANQAQYIEQEVERWLGIVDQPVDGEYRG
jgi:hypothetical protein